MKHTYRILQFLLLLALLPAGCIHDDPTTTPDGEEGVDPTLVQVSTEVTLNLALLPLEINTQQNARSGMTKAASGYARRFIIEARNEGKTTARQVTVLDPAAASGEEITLPIRLKLHAREYTLAVWMDYVEAGSEADLYYNTQELQQIACTDPYTATPPTAIASTGPRRWTCAPTATNGTPTYR